MNGVLHILDQAGVGLIQLQQRVAELEAENKQLREALGERPSD